MRNYLTQLSTENRLSLYLSLHSFGQFILVPWAHTKKPYEHLGEVLKVVEPVGPGAQRSSKRSFGPPFFSPSLSRRKSLNRVCSFNFFKKNYYHITLSWILLFSRPGRP